MKKFFTLLFSSLVIASTVFAQKEYAQISIADFKFPFNNIDELMPVVDEAGMVCFSAMQSTSIHFAIVSTAGEVVISQQRPLLFTAPPELLGTTTSAEYFTFYAIIKGGNAQNVMPVQVNKTTGEARRLTAITPAVEQKSKYITSFTENNSLYLLYYQKKNNLLQICRITDVHNQDVQSFTVDFSNVDEYFTKGGNWIFMNNNSDKTIFSGHHKKKMYKIENELTFVFDNFFLNSKSPNLNFTQLVRIDLEKQQASHKTFFFPRPAAAYNTYLHQNNLFKFSVDGRELKLEVFDAITQNLIKDYSYKKDEPIAIKATPVYRKMAPSLWAPDHIEISETSSSVLSKLAKGTPAITIAPADANTLVLTLGSYAVPRSGGGGAMMPMGGGTFATPGGTVTVPPTFMYTGSTGFYGNGSGTSTYFKAFLDAGTFEKAKAIAIPEAQDLVDDFEKELYAKDTKTGATAMIKKNNKLFYSYVDKRAKLLKVFSLDI